MSRKEKEEPTVVNVVDVVRHGERLILPESVTAAQAIEVLQRLQKQEEEVVRMSERILVYPWDGARALKAAIEQTFGVALQNSGWFGVRQIGVESGVGQTIQVPWGSFALPGVEGDVGCSVDVYEGRLVFEVEASIKRKHEPAIRKLIALAREIASKESIYRGQAVRMKFRRPDGQIDHNAQPKFMDLRNVESAVFSADLQREIDTNIIAPIVHSAKVREWGTPLKRGVLLAGKFGVGKTLLSANIARVATANGWTFVYCEDVRELPDAIKFAQGYQPCVIFAEDVDRVTSGPRDSDLDQVLNHLDGIESKGTEILTVVTTNAVESINEAMLRPGRLDVKLFVDPPDAEAVTRLIRMYGRDLIEEEDELSEVGVALQGKIPAIIREVVERSKLEMISRTDGAGGKIRAVDLLAATRTFLRAEERLRPATQEDSLGAMRAFGEGFAEPLGRALAEYLQRPLTVALSNGHNGANGNGADHHVPVLATGHHSRV